jgi:hypothetical protein
VRISGTKWDVALLRNQTLVAEVVLQMLAKALNLPADRIVIESLEIGSLVVRFTVNRNASQQIPDAAIDTYSTDSNLTNVIDAYVFLTGDTNDTVSILESYTVKSSIVASSQPSCGSACLIGIIAAAVVGVLAVVVTVACCVWRRRRFLRKAREVVGDRPIVMAPTFVDNLSRQMKAQQRERRMARLESMEEMVHGRRRRRRQRRRGEGEGDVSSSAVAPHLHEPFSGGASNASYGSYTASSYYTATTSAGSEGTAEVDDSTVFGFGAAAGGDVSHNGDDHARGFIVVDKKHERLSSMGSFINEDDRVHASVVEDDGEYPDDHHGAAVVAVDFVHDEGHEGHRPSPREVMLRAAALTSSASPLRNPLQQFLLGDNVRLSALYDEDRHPHNPIEEYLRTATVPTRLVPHAGAERFDFEYDDDEGTESEEEEGSTPPAHPNQNHHDAGSLERSRSEAVTLLVSPPLMFSDGVVQRPFADPSQLQPSHRSTSTTEVEIPHPLVRVLSPVGGAAHVTTEELRSPSIRMPPPPTTPPQGPPSALPLPSPRLQQQPRETVASPPMRLPAPSPPPPVAFVTATTTVMNGLATIFEEDDEMIGISTEIVSAGGHSEDGGHVWGAEEDEPFAVDANGPRYISSRFNTPNADAAATSRRAAGAYDGSSGEHDGHFALTLRSAGGTPLGQLEEVSLDDDDEAYEWDYEYA